MKRLILVLIAAACLLPLLQAAAKTPPPPLSALTVVTEYDGKALAGIHITICDTDGKEISRTTDGSGRAIFKDLPAGQYLVKQTAGKGGAYILAPCFVTLPGQAVIYPKIEPVLPGDENISISVYKLWAGMDSPPGGVSVQLYRNGIPYGSAVRLHAGNLWTHTWSGLDAAGIWTADEVSVPAGYTKTIRGSADTGFIITNTRQPGRPLPGPQTGDESNMRLWAALAAAGTAGLVTLLCAASIKRRRREGDRNA